MTHLSRREFVRIAAVAGSLASAEAKVTPSIYGGVQIGVMTYSFRTRPIAEALANITKLGLSSVELYSDHLEPFKDNKEEIKKWRAKFSDAGVKIASYYVDFADDATETQIDRGFETGGLLGAGIITSTSSKSVGPRVDKACQKFQMKCGFHNEVWPNKTAEQIEGPKDYEELLRNSSERLGVTLDVGHFYAAGHDPIAFILKHSQRIVGLHLKDRERDKKHTELPFGKGTTPLIGVVQTLRKLKFKNAANIEWEVPGTDPVQGVADALAYLKRGLGA